MEACNTPLFCVTLSYTLVGELIFYTILVYCPSSPHRRKSTIVPLLFTGKLHNAVWPILWTVYRYTVFWLAQLLQNCSTTINKDVCVCSFRYLEQRCYLHNIEYVVLSISYSHTMPLLWYEALWDFFLLDLLITHHLLKLGPTSHLSEGTGEWSAFALPRPEMREHLRGTVNALLVPLPTTLWQRVSKCLHSQSLISTTKCRDETNDSTEIGSRWCSRRSGWNSGNFMPTIQWISAYEWTDSQVDVCVEVDEADEGDDEGDDEPRQVHVVEHVVGVHPQVRRLFKRRDRELWLLLRALCVSIVLIRTHSCPSCIGVLWKLPHAKARDL